jgi:hypothetical protein
MANVCSCPNPPGGTVSCSDNQLAVCGYRDGVIVSGCFDKPDHAKQIRDDSERNVVLANWILSIVTGEARYDYDVIEPEEARILAKGRYMNPSTGDEIRFTAPRGFNYTHTAAGRPLVKTR